MTALSLFDLVVLPVFLMTGSTSLSMWIKPLMALKRKMMSSTSCQYDKGNRSVEINLSL